MSEQSEDSRNSIAKKEKGKKEVRVWMDGW
jgi:hypothetical protein